MKRRLAFMGVLVAAFLPGAVASLHAQDTQYRREVQTGDKFLRCRVIKVRETTIAETGESGAGSGNPGRTAGRRGLEYTVILTDGSEHVVRQEFLRGDGIVQVGDECRLLIRPDGERRVAPPPDKGDRQYRQDEDLTHLTFVRCRVLGVREAMIRREADAASGGGLATLRAVEYSIITASGSELTVLQEILEGDRIVRHGDNCRLWTGRDGKRRVFPAR